MPKPKLTDEQVAAVRAEAMATKPLPLGFYTRKAEQLGVSRNSMWQIVNFKRHAGKPKSRKLAPELVAMLRRRTWQHGEKKETARLLGISACYLYVLTAPTN